MTDFILISENQTRQLIDSLTVFDEHRRVQAEAAKCAGGMYWKRQGAYEYLVKTAPDNRQQRIGPRSPQTEHTYAIFTQRKIEAQSRLKALSVATKEAERMNKALKVGRAPSIVVALLQELEDAGLGAHFRVVGTHALYAYETAAGVRITQGALATQDVDLLWDARKRIQFITDLKRTDVSMLRILQRVDPSFQRKEMQNETAINERGFQVDFLRRVPMEGDPHSFRFSDNEEDLWPVQAERASVLTEVPGFEHAVISATGKMAIMRTIAPTAFVDFKRWMAKSAKHRPVLKRQRDLLQADIVQALLDQGLLVVA